MKPATRFLLLVLAGLTISCQTAPVPGLSNDDPRVRNHVAKAELFERQADLDAALAESRRAVAIAPNSSETQLLLGRYLRHVGKRQGAGKDDRAGNYRDSRVALERALALAPLGEAPRIELALLLVDSDQLKHAKEVLLPLAIAGHPEVRFHLASVHAAAGETSQSIELYRAGLAEVPENARARTALAMTLIQTGAIEAAAEELKRALVTDPSRADGFLQLGLVLAKLGDIPNALLAVARATELDPSNQQAFYNLSSLMRRQGMDAMAELPERQFQALKKATETVRERSEELASAPDRLDLKAELAAAFLAVGDLQRARALAASVLENSPYDLAARRTLARVYESLGDLAAAVAQLEFLFRRNPEDLTARHQRGRLLVGLGRYEEARQDLTAALAGDPKRPEYMAELARLALAADEPALVLQLVEPGIALLPPHPPLFKLAALALYRLGRYDESVGLSAAYLQWFPADIEIMKQYIELADAGGKPERAAEYRGHLRFITTGRLGEQAP